MYLISGSNDGSVPEKNINASHIIFQNFSTGYLHWHDSGNDGHRFGRDSPARMLQFIYESLGYTDNFVSNIDSPVSNPESLGSWTTFDQKEFFPGINYNTNNDFINRENGYLFVPNACTTDGHNCKVHFVLHGCNGQPDGMARNGYNELAVLNNIIMVYPDVKCWDNSGDIDSEDYNTN